MMKNALFLLLLCAASLAHAAVDVAGVKFEDKANLGQTELVLNGAGLRSKFILKVYAVGLYLGEKKTAAADVLGLKGAKRLLIVTLRDLTAEQFADALVEGIHKNLSDTEAEPIKAAIGEFKNAILGLKNATKGDVISIDWLPETGTRLTVNGKQQGRDIAGEDFYRALLRIWLGPKPAQDDLKQALLGK